MGKIEARFQIFLFSMVAIPTSFFLLGCSLLPASREAVAISTAKTVSAADTFAGDWKLHKTLAFGVGSSAIRMPDLDQDGFPEIVTISVTKTGSTELVIAWGERRNPWIKKWTQLLEPDGSRTASSLRDLSSHLIEVADLDSDKKFEIITSYGVVRNHGRRRLEWKDLPSKTIDLHPVAVIKESGRSRRKLIVRVLNDSVELCTLLDDCTPLAMPSNARVENFTDLVVGGPSSGPQFILAGGLVPDENRPSAVLWTTQKLQAQGTALKIPGIDYQVGNDAKGNTILVAQEILQAPGSAGSSAVYRWENGQLVRIQTLVNAFGQSDKSYLADMNGDGNLDFLQIGLHEKRWAAMKGQNGSLGTQWGYAEAEGGVGVQFFKKLLDHEDLIAVRAAKENRFVLKFFTRHENLN